MNKEQTKCWNGAWQHVANADVLAFQVNDPDAEVWMVSRSCLPTPERIVGLRETRRFIYLPSSLLRLLKNLEIKSLVSAFS